MSSATSDAPLSMLAMSLMEADEAPEAVVRADTFRNYEAPMQDMHDHMHDHMHDDHHDHHEGGQSWLSFIFYFLVLVIIFYFLYFALRPSFVLRHDECSDSRSFSDDQHREINNNRLLWSAVISSLVLVFVMWIFWWVVKY
jgi:hypothetical protein